MSFDPASILPKPRNWFTRKVEYVGRGRAEFASQTPGEPNWVVEGEVEIRFDEVGKTDIAMEVDAISPKPLFGIEQILATEPPIKKDDKYSLSIGTEFNPCISLTVSTTTPPGTFSVIDAFHYANRIGPDTIGFRPLKSQFVPSSGLEAYFWVMPLINFVSRFEQPAADLDSHPLRLYENATPSDKLIIFEVEGESGFIEPLADHKTLESTLVQRVNRQHLTAVTVGKLKIPSQEKSDTDWLRHNLLPILGLATGTQVEASWTELRSQDGKLVQRIHVRNPGSSYIEGHRMLDEIIHEGTGKLISQAIVYMDSKDFNASRLRVTLKHIIRGQMRGLTVEDHMSHLIRALDGLCNEYKLTTGTKLRTILGRRRNKAVYAAIQNVAKDLGIIVATIEAEKVNAESSNDDVRVVTLDEQLRALQGIKGRVIDSTNIRVGFDKSLIALLDRFQLPDAKILDPFIVAENHKDIKNWAQLIARYRGIVMHNGYIDFDGTKHDIHKISSINNHLHDLLVRIVLKSIGYTGTYQPTVIRWTTEKTVDWVQPNTTVKELGFS